MPAYRDPRNHRAIWRYRKKIKLPNGSTLRISGMPQINTKEGALKAERAHIERVLNPPPPPKKEVPTLDEWFHGRYWEEWVVGRKNKPSTVEGKEYAYKLHIGPFFGKMRLDEIKVGEISQFRALLIKKGLEEKSINNILAVLSKPLHYALDVELLDRAPKVGLFRVEQPEIVYWELEQYARLLLAAKQLGEMEYAAICLAGEAGLRVGEVKGLRWREDVDMVARTITVNQQMRKGIIGTPKGRTRRVVAMTDTLFDALKALIVVRTGFVIRDLDGEAKNDENQVKNLSYRVCRKAGLPERGWHCLRHTFGTHAAIFGVNPWRLMSWMGHKLINETHRYVHIAEAHMREFPPAVQAAAAAELQPDRRILKMLGARVATPIEPIEPASEKAPSPIAVPTGCQQPPKNEKASPKTRSLSLV
jgi:integrase